MPTSTFSANDINYIAKLNELANASFTQQSKSANFAAAKGFKYIGTVNALQVTMPTGPVAGDRFQYAGGSSGVTSVTFLYGSDRIDSATSNLTLSGETAVNVELAYVDATIGWRVIKFGSTAVNPFGKTALWIPANAMTPRVTNGAAVGATELATNRIQLATLDFDAATIEYAQFAVAMPKSWNESTVSFIPHWSHAATTVNFGVVWGLRAMARSDGEALDNAMGTGVTVTDTGGTTSSLYIAPESGAVTIGSTPAAQDLVIFEVYRDATNGSDTMAVDARLTGITLFITTDAATDA